MDASTPPSPRKRRRLAEAGRQDGDRAGLERTSPERHPPAPEQDSPEPEVGPRQASPGSEDGDSPAEVGPRLPPRLRGASEASSPEAGAQWAKERLPPPQAHELEFLIKDPRSYKQGKSVTSPILTMHNSFRFRILAFPAGTDSTGKPEQLAAFVEAVPPDDCKEVRWAYEGVRYQISLVNWLDYRKTVTQNDMFSFQRDSTDRGWHKGFVKASDMTTENGWLSKDGELCLRAACCSRRALIHVTQNAAACRRNAGYVGLRNHGATCYMNCLLQTLFHIGRFRQIVYCIDCEESADQAAGSDDDVPGTAATAEAKAQPLPVALQNLFHRLETSEVPVSCRELMRSFGWDTADAFMQHDAQELNRLLCDRLEEQMKGTSMDGAIKRLFEGEMENYIECVDIEYRSTRNETFYDLQLNVRNEAGRELTSLEESLRDFTSEETLEGENAYDAGSHGKQKARKGCRFKRFPPVLYIQMKRFMFDVERMDMCKLNGRLEFPQVLDLEALAPGSGKYLLHTVAVHSGGVSSGHYYAFVRVPGGSEGGFRWVKFDDEQVVSCSEQAAVEDNYGGEDPMVWDYFKLSPDRLSEHTAPRAERIHNGYMLSYIRADLWEEILTPPPVDGEERKCRRVVERCAREACLAEERRRARSEQAQRIEVRLLLERDLIGMEGFWTHQDLPCSYHCRMGRDQPVQELCYKAEELVDVPETNLALFLLSTRSKTRQTRFRHLRPEDRLRQHLPPHGGAPHNSQSDPLLIVLCVVSRGFDPYTLEWSEKPGQVPAGPHELCKWKEEICLLIVKYFCPVTRNVLTLGCYYMHSSETLQEMVAGEDSFLRERLRPFVEKKEVAPLAPDAPLLCWEEFCFRHPKDFHERNVHGNVDKEGLSTGDILIWQPAVPRITSPPSPPSEEGAGLAPQSEDSEFPVLTVRDLATRLFNQVQVVVRLHAAEALWCPEGVAADGRWGGRAPEVKAEVKAEVKEELTESARADAGEGPPPGDLPRLPDGRGGSSPAGAPREADVRVLAADLRWRLEGLASRALQAFELASEVAEGRPAWLFDGAVPAAVDEAPVFRTGAEGTAAGQRQLSELFPRSAAMVPQGWPFHLVLLPCPPPETPDARPVAIHFFDASVREVGACILYIADAGAGGEAPGDEDSPPTGRPALDPAEVLELARRHLERPGNEHLLSLLAPAGESREAPALRLVDASRGRLRAVFRPGSAAETKPEGADSDGPALWPPCGANFLAAALRVEPDWDEGAESTPAASQLVEVFNAEHSGRAFGHPFLLRVHVGDRAPAIARRLQEKLGVPDAEMRHWRLLLAERERRTLLEDITEEWPAIRDVAPARPAWAASSPAFCVERIHPLHRDRSPVAGLRMMRAKPLTIKAK